MTDGARRTCCFFGHREINETVALKEQVSALIEHLIETEKVGVFLFGSKSRFNDLCYELVSLIKQKHPNIKRVYVRAQHPYISDSYKEYLLEKYEETYYPEKVIGAGRASYLVRNYEMIKRSDFCVVYYQPDFIPATGKSGTKLAFDFAISKGKQIITFPRTE